MTMVVVHGSGGGNRGRDGGGNGGEHLPVNLSPRILIVENPLTFCKE